MEWIKGILQRVSEIKLKDTQYEEYDHIFARNSIKGYTRIAKEDIALIKVKYCTISFFFFLS